MRYLSIITSKLVQITQIDLKKKRINRAGIIDAIYYTDKFRCIGIESRYENPLTQGFQRNSAGEILVSERPIRLDTEALLQRLQGLLDKRKARAVHSNSLANLRPGPQFTDRKSVV